LLESRLDAAEGTALSSLLSGMIQPEFAHELHRQPYIDRLRDRVRDEDVPRLLEIAGSSHPAAVRVLAISLLKNACDRGDVRVREGIMELWGRRHDYVIGRTVMWRLLDDPEIQLQSLYQCFEFVRAHWNRWTKDLARWHGGRDGVLRSIRQRLSDPKTPNTKAWAYICASAEASPRQELVTFLENQDSRLPLVPMAIEETLRRLSQDDTAYLETWDTSAQRVADIERGFTVPRQTGCPLIDTSPYPIKADNFVQLGRDLVRRLCEDGLCVVPAGESVEKSHAEVRADVSLVIQQLCDQLTRRVSDLRSRRWLYTAYRFHVLRRLRLCQSFWALQRDLLPAVPSSTSSITGTDEDLENNWRRICTRFEPASLSSELGTEFVRRYLGPELLDIYNEEDYQRNRALALHFGAADPRILALSVLPVSVLPYRLAESVLLINQLAAPNAQPPTAELQSSPSELSRVQETGLQAEGKIHRLAAISAYFHDSRIPDSTMSAADRITHKGLVGGMRILQWDVLVRDLYDEYVTERYKYNLVSSFSWPGHGAAPGPRTAGLPFMIHRAFQAALSTSGWISCQIGAEPIRPSCPSDQGRIALWRRGRQDACRDSFSRLLQDVGDKYPRSFDDVIHSFAAIRRYAGSVPLSPNEAAIVIRDGEFTFWHFIWSLRRYHADSGRRYHGCEQSCLDGNEFYEAISHEKETKRAWWSMTAEPDSPIGSVDIIRWMYQLGLGALVPDQATTNVLEWKVVVTERWESFLEWLIMTRSYVRDRAMECGAAQHLAKREREDGSAYASRQWDLARDPDAWWRILSPLLPLLPVKTFEKERYGARHRVWIGVLAGFFLSNAAEHLVNQFFECVTKQNGFYRASMPMHQFQQLLCPKSEWLDLLTAPGALTDIGNTGHTVGLDEEPSIARTETSHATDVDPGVDALVCELSRCVCLPLELLFRSYQPYTMHLLTMPQNFAQTPWGQHDVAPTSIAFATLVGELPPSMCEQVQFSVPCRLGGDGQAPAMHREGMDQVWDLTRSDPELSWISPYWTLFLSIGGAFGVYKTQEEAQRVGAAMGRRGSRLLQTHEIRDLVQAIDRESSSWVLTQVQRYFHMLSLDPLRIREKGLEDIVVFSQGELLENLVRRVFEHQLMIRLIVEKAAKGTQLLWPNNKEAMKAANKEFGYSLRYNVPRLLEVALPRNNAEQLVKVAFIGVLAAALGNAMAHSPFGSEFGFTTTSDAVMVVTNPPKPNEEGRPGSGGTIDVMRELVSFYDKPRAHLANIEPGQPYVTKAPYPCDMIGERSS
jgi:hypothetical protein